MLCFFSAKGGVGCSVMTVAAALLSSERQPTLLVDLHGELAPILGLASDLDGLAGWFQTDAASPDLLRRLEVSVTDSLSLLPHGRRRPDARPERYQLLASLLGMERRQVIVDVGTSATLAVAVVAEARSSILVTRACYLALRAASGAPAPDHVLLIAEPGRALRASDVEAALGAPVTATIPWDPAVARAVDAGLLAARRPRRLNGLGVFL